MDFFSLKGHSKIWSAKFSSPPPKLGAKSPSMGHDDDWACW